MPRNLLQDMVKKTSMKEKSIERPIRSTFNTANTDEKKVFAKIKYERKNNKESKYRIYVVALISVVFLLFALSFLFSGAKVTVVPKVKEIPLSNENLSAAKNGSAPGLSFDLVVISGEENKTMQSNGVDAVAKGTVSIFNSFSSSPQVLAVDTRLEGSNGKIYKTSTKVTIPGETLDGKPGKIEVGIYGAAAGIEYNSVPLDFQILGFKGTPKYSKFKVRSIGEIISGPIVSSLDKATAVSELKTTLETKLSKKVTNQIPPGFILFKDAVFTNIDDKDVSFTPDKENTISVNVKGTLYGFLFDEKKLTTEIAQDIIDKYDESEVYMPNIRNLTFSLSDKENISFADVKSVNFSLSGTPKIIWKVDEAKFIRGILGKKKSDFNQILSQYPNIDSAVLVIRPFWKTSFPDKSKNIQVIVNYPK